MHFDDIFRSLTVYEPESSTCEKKKEICIGLHGNSFFVVSDFILSKRHRG